MTTQEKFVVALVSQGLTETAATSKYRVVGGRPDGQKYYIGTHGSVRLGKTIAGSLPLTDKAKAGLLATLPTVTKAKAPKAPAPAPAANRSVAAFRAHRTRLSQRLKGATKSVRAEINAKLADLDRKIADLVAA